MHFQTIFLLAISFLSVICAFMPGSAHISPRKIMRLSIGMKLTGKVKFFNVTKGFGFITPDDGSGDVFVHQTAIHAAGFRSLAEGEPVEYDVVNDPTKNKIFASNVTGPNGSYVQGASKDSSFQSNRGGDRRDDFPF